jgi:hypothetical protein
MSGGFPANKDHALDDLRRLTLAETRPEHILTALQSRYGRHQRVPPKAAQLRP